MSEENIELPGTIEIGDELFHCPYKDLFRPLTVKEYDDLSASIERRGILDHVLMTEDGGIVSGMHRMLVASKKGFAIGDIPIRYLKGKTKAELLQIAKDSNMARRHFGYNEWMLLRKKMLVEAIKADPEKTDAEVADEVGMRRETVASNRKKLEEKGEIEKKDTRKKRDGNATTVPDKKTKKDDPIGDEEGVRTKKPKPETEPLKPPKIMCPSNEECPETLKDIFAPNSLALFSEAAQTIMNVKMDLERYRKSGYPTITNLMIDSLVGIAALISGAAPFGLCEYCQHTGQTPEGDCQHCMGQGWYPYRDYQE